MSQLVDSPANRLGLKWLSSLGLTAGLSGLFLLVLGPRLLVSPLLLSAQPASLHWPPKDGCSFSHPPDHIFVVFPNAAIGKGPEGITAMCLKSVWGPQFLFSALIEKKNIEPLPATLCWSHRDGMISGPHWPASLDKSECETLSQN